MVDKVSGDLTTEVSRRTLLKGVAASAGLIGTSWVVPSLVGPGARAIPPPGTGRGRAVAVFGGGMSGLAAAQELIERGFSVTVYEPAFLGGKARSMDVPGSAVGGRMALPGEHGFRFFPGCYQHVPDTMARIPLPGGGNVRDRHLINVEGAVVALDEPGYAPVTVPQSVDGFVQHAPAIADLENLRNTLMTALKIAGDVPVAELAFFVQRELIIATSCEERRIGQWEKQSWMEFVKAKGKSSAYQKYLVSALTRATVAAKPDMGSARTIGQIGLALVTSATGLISQYAGTIVGGGVDRILNLPTNHAWIDPWVAYLRGRGVHFVMGQAATAFDVQGGQITRALVSDGSGATSAVTADWYVAAMPLDRLKPLLRTALLSAAPSLEGINNLVDDWMVGIQYFLSRRADVVPSHIAALGTPWALTGLFQAAPWEVDFGRIYGDGRVHDCLSVDVSDWDTPGILYGKTAKQCTRDEIAREVWAQMGRALNRGPTPILRDSELVSWHLDPGITWSPTISNATPLMVNTADSYRYRPTADTAIPNFFIGGDHVRTNIDLATMEGANESGRRVANAILDAAGSNSDRAAVHPLWELPLLDPFKLTDRDRCRAGLPHVMDV
jgi:uncharacterized protein with NAD-binding domain and iron-sulfur cluster